MSSDEKQPVPTKPGAYYRVDGGATLCVESSMADDLDAVSIGVGAYGYVRSDASSIEWATDDAGSPIEVPLLAEWLAAQTEPAPIACTCGSGAHPRPCDAHPDRYAAHCAELSADAAQDAYDQLIEALDVPDGADPLKWASKLAHGASMVRRREGNNVVLPSLEWAREVLALRAPPRPVPDGPGWWWGRYDCDAAMRPYLVTICESMGLACEGEHAPYGGGSVSLTNANWTWLAGPDGRAVRCTPPKVDRG